MRLVSICPSNTELLAYIGLDQYLVGIDDYSNWPQTVEMLPRLGPDLSIRIDEVEKLKPDLVLASLSVPGMEKNVKQLKERNIPHVVYNPKSLHDIKDDLLNIANRTGKEKIAHEVIARFDETINTYKSLAATVEKVRVYWEWWPRPVFSPGGTNWLTEISKLAGAHNIFASKNTDSVQTDWDDVFELQPDHICLTWVGIKTEKVNPELLWKRPKWDSLQALKKNRIHVLEDSLFCRPSPRLLLGLKTIAAILHPQIFPKNDFVDPLLMRN